MFVGIYSGELLGTEEAMKRAKYVLAYDTMQLPNLVQNLR
jgi:hypothetical protein